MRVGPLYQGTGSLSPCSELCLHWPCHLLGLSTKAGASTVGLDTWRSPTGKVKEPVKEAFGAGNHHVDCACVLSEEWDGESHLREGCEARGPLHHEQVMVHPLWEKLVKEICQKILKDLKLDHLDIYLDGWDSSLGKTFPQTQERRCPRQ